LADLIEPWGLECLRVSYRPAVPPEQARFGGGLRGFFWPRTTSLDWRHVGPLLGQTRFHSFHLHTADTRGQAVLPAQEQVRADDWVRTEWFDQPQDYHRALAEANVFFAPRRQEGIGMAVLEALALGQCVVAPNQPTACEYITSGVDGWLYDADIPVALDFAQAEAMGRQARQAALAGRALWQTLLPSIRQFLETIPRSPRRFHPWIILKGKVLAGLRWGYRIGKRWRTKGTTP
jgi:glycosyltransferase involved in cell wall biosynthesis